MLCKAGLDFLQTCELVSSPVIAPLLTVGQRPCDGTASTKKHADVEHSIRSSRRRRGLRNACARAFSMFDTLRRIGMLGTNAEGGHGSGCSINEKNVLS